MYKNNKKNEFNRRDFISLFFIFSAIFYLFISNILFFYGIESSIFNVSFSIIIKIIILLIMIIIIIFIIINPKNRLPTIIGIICLMFFSMFFSIVINTDFAVYNLLISLVDSFFWIAIFFITYYSSKHRIRSNYIPYFILIALVYIYILFLSFQLGDNINTPLSMNSVYYILLALPLILMIKNNLIKILSILIIFSATIISLKRTALIALVVSLLFYYIINLYTTGTTMKKRLYTVLILLISLISLLYSYSYIIEYFNLDWSARLNSLANDGGSGRENIYRNVIDAQLNSNFFEWLMGHGYNAVYVDLKMGLTAHNDFLEIMYNYGILTFISYISLILYLIIYNIKMIKVKSSVAAPFSVSLILFLVMSLTSHLIIYPTYFILLVAFWGIEIAKFDTNFINFKRVNK